MLRSRALIVHNSSSVTAHAVLVHLYERTDGIAVAMLTCSMKSCLAQACIVHVAARPTLLNVQVEIALLVVWSDTVYLMPPDNCSRTAYLGSALQHTAQH